MDYLFFTLFLVTLFGSVVLMKRLKRRYTAAKEYWELMFSVNDKRELLFASVTPVMMFRPVNSFDGYTGRLYFESQARADEEREKILERYNSTKGKGI